MMSASPLFEPTPTEESRSPSSIPAATDTVGGAAGTASIAMTRSLYRKYRPQSFADDDLVGQEHVVRILRNAIRLDRVAHAYLFCGPRGTGKTTTARLLAKAVNCLDPDPTRRPCNQCASCAAIATGAAIDIVEIDAASNRGIDDIRDLRERVKFAPVQLRVKFYIVDEAHQITGAAANAFLKTLEEPPLHTKFVLATTDPEELLPTIVSRCQRFDFRRIGFAATVQRLRTVAEAEGLAVTDEALAVIARNATGSLRDALGLLDQLSLYEDEDRTVAIDGPVITADTVRAMLGISRNDRVESLVTALAERDARTALETINVAVAAGEDPRQINRQLVAYLRILLHQRAGGTLDADERARGLAARFELWELADLARRFGELDFAIKHSPYSQLPLEVALVEALLQPAPEPGTARPTATRPPTMSAKLDPSPTLNATDSPVARQDRQEPPRPPTRSLRDRVRGIESEPPLSLGSRTAPATTEGRSAASSSTEQQAVSSAPTSDDPTVPRPLDVERLAELWPRIRQDVKAVNRRIEALLSSVDPARVEGDRVMLSTPYPFHRDKLNSDEVRDVVESVIRRLGQRPVTVRCVLHDEVARPVASVPAAEAAAAAATVLGPAPGGAPAAGNDPDPTSFDADEQRLRAAKNIFDAEEIDVVERAR